MTKLLRNFFRLFSLAPLLALEAAGQGLNAEPQDNASPAPVVGQVRLDPKGIEQVWVPAGKFLMGSDGASIKKLKSQNPPAFVLAEFASEQPQHEVEITRGYWIDKYEVSNKNFGIFVADGGYQKQEFWSEEGWAWLGKHSSEQLPRACHDNLPDHPVACVTWYEAEAYAAWRGARLPTEAEWEYAARGPESLVYPWGNEFGASKCNVVGGYESKPVGSYPEGASWVGALDMAGNVMEWVQDWLAPHSKGPSKDPKGPKMGTIKVEKGGWFGATFFVARSAYRHFEDPPSYGDGHIGFRLVSHN